MLDIIYSYYLEQDKYEKEVLHDNTLRALEEGEGCTGVFRMLRGMLGKIKWRIYKMIIKNVIVYTEDKNLQQAALLFTMTRSKAFTRQKTYRICWGRSR